MWLLSGPGVEMVLELNVCVALLSVRSLITLRFVFVSSFGKMWWALSFFLDESPPMPHKLLLEEEL